MENQTEPSKTSTASSMPSVSRAERLGWIIEQLGIAAIAKGQTHTPERLRVNAEDLIDIPQADLTRAFDQARRELDYVPQVSEIRRLALAEGTPARLDAETRAAWDVLIKFVNKWCRWNDGYFSARVEQGAPKLPQRITDTVRRTGGWAAYLGMVLSDFPHQQKRFYEEYQAWIAVECVLPDLEKQIFLLPASPLAQLPRPSEPAAPPKADVKPFSTKPVPEPLTEFQCAERRRHLQQSARALAEKRVGRTLTDEEYRAMLDQASKRVLKPTAGQEPEACPGEANIA